LDGDAFILQVQGVFSHIHLGARPWRTVVVRLEFLSLMRRQC
jgi:hypothetical protein